MQLAVNQTQYSDQPLHITPFYGQYEQHYSKAEWVEDVVAYNAYYNSQINYKQGVLKHSLVENWMLFILLFGFTSLAYVRTMYRKRFNMLVQTFSNWKVSKQIIRYEKVYAHPVNILLTINFILCFPLFFCLWAAALLEINYSLIPLYFSILGPLLIYIVLKLLVYKGSGWLVALNEPIEEYVFQANLFNKYLGVVYLILISFMMYSPISSDFLAQTGLAILVIFLSFQLIRGVIIGIENGINLYLIILYLCSLEILPWLVLGKWVKSLL